MTKPKLRKKAENSPPQSPHDGIHTCSKGCSKPGCNRALRDTIEEQDQQIEALKRDVLEKAAKRVHDDDTCPHLVMLGRLEAENARLRSVAEDNKRECEATRIENARLREQVERLKMNAYNRLSMRIEIDKLNARIEHLIKAGDLMADGINGDYNYSLPCIEEWNAAKEGKQSK